MDQYFFTLEDSFKDPENSFLYSTSNGMPSLTEASFFPPLDASSSGSWHSYPIRHSEHFAVEHAASYGKDLSTTVAPPTLDPFLLENSFSPQSSFSPSSSSDSGSGSTFSTPGKRDSLSLSPPRLHCTLPPHKHLKAHKANPDSDYEADADSDNDEDEEYLPSRELSNSRKRRRRSVPKTQSRTRSSAPRPVKPLPKSGRVTKRPRLIEPGTRTEPSTCASRLEQASSEIAKRIKSALEKPDADGLEYKCPQCSHTQKDKRMPDFKRHLAAHIRADKNDESGGWWCKGILYADFEKEPEEKQQAILSRHEINHPYMFLGKLRIGGCRKTFSRRDALKRHLNKTKCCIGTAGPPHED